MNIFIYNVICLKRNPAGAHPLLARALHMLVSPRTPPHEKVATTMGDDYYNEGNVSVPCASWAPAVGFMGCVFAVVFSSELKILKEKSMV